jgi:3-deoxy-D-manno-octulosonic-acid transferase
LGADVWVGDSLGEMAAYYSLADVALLGGSFLPLGGHNLIEAAANGCPLFAGPSTFNFAEAMAQAVAEGAAWRTSDMESALVNALALIADAPKRQAAASAGLAFAAAHRGASARMAAAILAVLAHRPTLNAPEVD